MISIIVNFRELNDFFIRETINNILNQTYKNFEILVNINFEKQDFINILEENDISLEKISIYQEEDVNFIIENFVKGEYIIFKKFEHKWMPDKLKIMKQEFENNTEEELDMVYSDCFFCDELDNIIKENSDLKSVKKPLYLIKKMKNNSFNLENMFKTNIKKIEKKLYLNQVA